MTTPQSSQSPGGLGERELLELAAKAAGIPLIELNGVLHFADSALGDEWRPHEDDGQALRLAVELGICIEFTSCADGAPVVYCGPDHQRRDWPMTPNFPDPFKETRRAIVRAAAATASERRSS